MKRYLFNIATVVLFLLLINGCKKEDNPVESDATKDIANPTGQPMPSFANTPDFGGSMASINYYVAAPIAGLPDVSTNAASAIFGDGVDAGAVSVNNNQLGKLNAGGKTYYMAPDVNNPTNVLNLSWGGANHSWSVAGANGIPALNGAVRSPNDYSITSPTANASVTKSNGIQVRWSNTSTTSKILVQIINIKDKGQAKVYQELNDNGSYTIPASDLTSFSGDCQLFVVRYNYNSVTAANKKYYMVSEIVKSINIKVN
ncbi:MAG: hypothetical protein N2321_00290 [Melioribacteraceae bacterium]|nr:hypothetical protein [Melioribacteraceae bacterium]